jgi:hypothetical protein
MLRHGWLQLRFLLCAQISGRVSTLFKIQDMCGTKKVVQIPELVEFGTGTGIVFSIQKCAERESAALK